MNNNVQSVTRRFDWIIDGATTEKLEAPDFEHRSESIFIKLGDNMTEWYLKMHNKDEGNTRSSLNITLCKKKVLRDDFHVFARFSMTLGLQKYFVIDRKCTDFQPGKRCSDVISTAEFILYSNDRPVVIPFEITLTCSNSTEVPPVKASDFMIDFWERSMFTDFVLESSDKVEFKVHRTSMAGISSFFLALLTTEMQEKIQGKVTFDDIDSSALKSLLNFVYKGEVNFLSVEHCINILYAAEKFDIAALKSHCSIFLAREVKLENVAEILTTAERFNITALESTCLDFICSNFFAFMQGCDFMDLDRQLVVKIMKAFDYFKESSMICPIKSML